MARNKIIIFIAFLLIGFNIFSMDRENKTLALPEELNLEIFKSIIKSYIKDCQSFDKYMQTISDITNLRLVSHTFKDEVDDVLKRIKNKVNNSEIDIEYLKLDYDKTDSNLTNCFKQVQDDCNSFNENIRKDIINNAKNEYKNTLGLLIKYKFEITPSFRFKANALVRAAANGNKETLEILINNNVDVNLQRNDGYTALMMAVIYEYKEIVEILIKHNADVNLQNNDNDTALIWAVRDGRKEIVEILINNNAKINLQNNNGHTALMLAVNYNYTEIEKILKKNGAV